MYCLHPARKGDNGTSPSYQCLSSKYYTPISTPLANNKSRNNIQILETEVKGVSIYI